MAKAPLEYRLIQVVHSKKYDCTLVTFQDEDLRGSHKVKRLEAEFAQLAKLLEDPRLLIDFQKVQVMPTAILGLILQLIRDVSEKDACVRFCQMERNVRKAFELIAGKRMIDISDTRKDALSTSWDKKKWYWPFG